MPNSAQSIDDKTPHLPLTSAPPSAPLISWTAITALLAFIVGLFAQSVFWDPDTYWHIAAGRWMLEHREIPSVDPFSHSMNGTPWTAHEWVSQLIITLVHRYAGWGGIQVVTAAFFATTVAYIARFLGRRLEPVHMLAAIALSASLIFGHLLARPHVISWLLMAVWTGSLVEASESRRRPSWLLLLLMVAWANLHLSYALALVVGGGIALDAIFSELTNVERAAKAREWGLFFALCGVALLLNPHGWQALQYTISVMGMKSLSLVSEWRSADFHEFQTLLLWLLVVLSLAFAGMMRLSWPRALLTMFLLYIALKHQRYHSLLGLISPFILAMPFARARYGTATVSPAANAERLDRIFRSLSGPARPAGVAAMLLLAAGIAWSRVHFNPPQPPLFTTPAAAVESFLATGVRGNVFNSYNFGGYLIYRGIPVMIDGRSDMYGDEMMDEVSHAVRLTKAGMLDTLISRHQITWTLLTPASAAAQLLDRLPEWKRVYADTIAVVHVRRDSLRSE